MQPRSFGCSVATESVVTHIIALLESVNTAAGINKLLLAGEERMAVGANIYAHIALGGASFVGSAAGTSDYTRLIVGMDSLLHNTFHLFRCFFNIQKQSKYENG